MYLGGLLKNHREEHNMTVRDAAEMSGVSHSTISRIERGKGVSLLSFALVVYWLEVDVNDVFHETVTRLYEEE